MANRLGHLQCGIPRASGRVCGVWMHRAAPRGILLLENKADLASSLVTPICPTLAMPQVVQGGGSSSSTWSPGVACPHWSNTTVTQGQRGAAGDDERCCGCHRYRYWEMGECIPGVWKEAPLHEMSWEGTSADTYMSVFTEELGVHQQVPGSLKPRYISYQFCGLVNSSEYFPMESPLFCLGSYCPVHPPSWQEEPPPPPAQGVPRAHSNGCSKLWALSKSSPHTVRAETSILTL